MYDASHTTYITVGIWLVFIAYWVSSARGVKKNRTPENAWWRWAGPALAAVLALVSRAGYLQFRLVPYNAVTASAGISLCAAGVAFAIWARWRLGANWSTVPRLKEGHELITTGPYRWVRHPIYTGVLLAMLGTVLVREFLWCILLAILCPLCVHRLKSEEKLLETEFPAQYPEYKKRTKALIPFVW